MELIGIIQDGKFQSPRKAELLEWCRKNEGKTVVFNLTVQRKKRSNDQNSFYHGVCVPMVQAGMYELGNEMSLQETHEFLKKELNYKEVPSKFGELMRVPRSTTELTTVEFVAYIERIQRFAAEYLGIVIPDPNSAPELILITPTQHGFIAESTI